MTFLEEEEVFPTFIVSDAPAIEEVNATVNDVTVNASATSGKEEDNVTSEVVEAKQNGKRKLSDKQADKKVLPYMSSCCFFFLIILYGHLYCVLVNLNWDCSDAEYSGYDSLSYLYTLAGS